MELNNASQTEWNGGTLTNIRLHDIREQIRMCALNKDVSMWLALLEQKNHELYGFQTTEEKQEIRTELKNLAEKINKHISISKISRIRSRGIPVEIIDSLNEMEYKLDEVFHKSGLQTALKDDAGDSF